EESAVYRLANPVVSWVLVELQFLGKGGKRYLAGRCSVVVPAAQRYNGLDRLPDGFGDRRLDTLGEQFLNQAADDRVIVQSGDDPTLIVRGWGFGVQQSMGADEGEKKLEVPP